MDVSPTWYTLCSSCYKSDVCSVQRLCNFEYSVQYIDAVQRFVRDFFRRKQPEECFQLGLVSGRWYHRHGIRFLSDSLSAVKHGSNSIHHRILVNVPRLFFHRLCHGSEKIWYQRLGMVYCLRHISCDLFTPHSVATGNRRHVCCLHDLICIPYYRIFPYYVVF